MDTRGDRKQSTSRVAVGVRVWLASLLMAGAVAGCGGGGGGGSDVNVVAVADAVRLRVGETAQLLDNDRLGSEPAVAGSGGNVDFAITSNAPPAGVSVSNGAVSIGSSAAPGMIALSYRICAVGKANRCAESVASIEVEGAALALADDAWTLPAGGTGDVLANDLVDGAAPVTGQLRVSAVASLPAGLSLDTSGVLSVGGTVAAGSYTIDYRACAVAMPANCATATVSLLVPARSAVTGRVFDTSTGQPVAGVRVSAGGASATTNASGRYTLTGIPDGDRVVVQFQSDRHAAAAKILNIGETVVDWWLVPAGQVVELDIATGGTVTVIGTSAQVVFPANAVEREDGSAASSPMRVRLTLLDPSIDSRLLPGDYRAQSGAGSIPIESFGGLEVVATDATGAVLRLRTGITLDMRIALRTRSAAPPVTAPNYRFDLTVGLWRAFGTASLQGAGSSGYYDGVLESFGTWSAGAVMPTVSLSGCVVDANGAPASTATVRVDGIDYSSAAAGAVDAQGRFTIPIRRNGQATVNATVAADHTNTMSAGPHSSDATLSPCLSLTTAGQGLTATLVWGEQPQDMDAQLFLPDGSIVYFGNRGSLAAAPFASLDVDDRAGFGPEVITATRLMVGTYRYVVSNFSGQAQGMIGASGARVDLSLPSGATEVFAPPASGETMDTDWWLPFAFDVDAQCNVTLRRLDAYTDVTPEPDPQTAPVFCTPP